MRTRHTFTATIVVALLAIAGVTAAIAADPPPPRIAFVANGRVPADALAAGPTAGQLGAPIYTTEQDSLPQATSDALDAYNPQLVIVLGGPVAISDNVVNAIAAVTGLPTVDPTPPPSSGVVRAAGADRFATAAAIGDLLGDYNPAALPADAQGRRQPISLDGKDSTAFQPAGDYLGATDTAADSDKLEGRTAAELLAAAPVATACTDGGRYWHLGDHPTRRPATGACGSDPALGLCRRRRRWPRSRSTGAAVVGTTCTRSGAQRGPAVQMLIQVRDLPSDADGVASDEGYTIVAPLTPGDLATPLSVTTSLPRTLLNA